MLGLNVNKIQLDAFENFYDFEANNQDLQRATFVVDKHGRTFLKRISNTEDIDLVYLNAVNSALTEAEIYRLLNYKFEGHILPDIQISDLNVQIIRNSALEINLRLKNSGKVPLLGLGTQSNHYDRICINLYQNEALVYEHYIDFPYRVIKPNEGIYLHSVIDHLNLKDGKLVFEVGLFKDTHGWITTKESRAVLELAIDSPTSCTQVDISKMELAEKIIAFTFDGGGSLPPSKGVLEILAQTDTEATFFFTGAFVDKHPEYTKQVLESGHEIGNHTYSHPKLCVHTDPDPLPEVSANFLKAELSKMSDALFKLCGVREKAIWRAPFGAINSWTNAWAYSAGYTHIFWTFDSNDWRIPDTRQPDWTEEEVLKRLQDFTRDPPNGSIILFHIGVDYNHKGLKAGMIEVIKELKKRGYTFVRIGDIVPPK